MQPCPSPFNLAAYVLEAGQTTPDKIALAELGPARATRWSFARLTQAVMGMAAGLQARGLAPGDRVLLRMGNTAEFPIAFLGAIAAGCVPVPTAESLTLPEITKMAQVIAPKAILAHPGIALPSGCDAVIHDDLPALMATPPLPTARMGSPEDIAYLVFTSGSSGQPKPVAHSHRAVWARRMMWQGWYGLTAEDRVLHAGAFNWTYTLGTGLLDPWAIGATALIPAPGTAPEMLPLLLKRHETTIFAAVPGIYRKLLSKGAPLDLPHLRHGLSAGEKLPAPIRSAWKDATGTDIHEALGMSECSTFVSGCPAHPAAAGTLGRPQPGRRIAVLTTDGVEVPRGEVGILAVHDSDPGLFAGYAMADGSIDRRLTGDWFLTGDLVAQDPDGTLRYHGRRDDLLTTGGFRIAPLELESLFQTAPGVTDCAVTAVTVKAETHILALIHTGTASETDLRALAQSNLASYKQPRLYLRRDTLPRSANGKLDRNALGALLKDHA